MPPRIKYPVPECALPPVLQVAPVNVQGVALPSTPPLTISSDPPELLTVKVTGMDTGVLVAPVAETVIVPL